METDPTRMCELLVGLPEVTVLGIEDVEHGPLRIHVETRAEIVGCPTCGSLAAVKDRPVITLVDLPALGRPTRLVWHKRRLCCTDPDCPTGSWTEVDERIAAPRQMLSARAARWATFQVGRHARSVNEVAQELGCDWHTVNTTVLSYGEALLAVDTERIGRSARSASTRCSWCARVPCAASGSPPSSLTSNGDSS